VACSPTLLAHTFDRFAPLIALTRPRRWWPTPSSPGGRPMRRVYRSLLLRAFRALFRGRPQARLELVSPTPRPRPPALAATELERRGQTGNIVNGLVGFVLGGAMPEPLEVMAVAAGNLALLAGPPVPGAGATPTFSTAPPADPTPDPVPFDRFA